MLPNVKRKCKYEMRTYDDDRGRMRERVQEKGPVSSIAHRPKEKQEEEKQNSHRVELLLPFPHPPPVPNIV